MTPAPDAARLADLHSYEVLDTPADPAFDALVRAAAAIAGCPTALVSLVDEDRQWFKARCGLDAASTGRDVAFCDHVVRSGEVLVVPDTHRDARFAENPLVTGPPHLRFYAGFPLRSAGGVLGTLCVLSDAPRPEGLTPEQVDLLGTLAEQVMAQLVLRRTNRELARSQDAYRALAEAGSDIVSRHTPDGRVVYVSPSVRTVLGYDPADELGLPAPDRVHPDDAPALEDALRAVGSGAARTTQVTVRSRSAAGAWRWLEIALTALRDDDGSLREVHSVARDVTDRVEAVAELARAEERAQDAARRYEHLLASLPDAVLVQAAGVVVFANDAAARLLAAPDVGALLGRPTLSLVEPGTEAGSAARAAKVLAEDVRVQEQQRMVGLDGRSFLADVHVRRVDWHGQPAVQKVLRDVTAAEAARAAVELSEQRFRTLFDESPVGQLELSPDGVVLGVNTAFASLLGHPASAFFGRGPEWFTDAGELPDQAARLSQAARGSAPLTYERVLRRADGAAVEVEGTVAALTDAQGRTTRIVASVVDVTDRNRSRRELEQVAAVLQQERDVSQERGALIETVLATLDVGIVACDEQGRLTLFNRAAKAFHGTPEDASVDAADWASTYSLFAEDGEEPLAREQVPLYRALVEGEVHDAGMTIAPAGRPARTVRCDGRAIVDAEGRLRGAVVAMTDVTASRAAARTLAEREEFLRVLLETAQTAVLACDEAGRPTFANQSAAELFGSPDAATLLQQGQQGRVPMRALADDGVTPLAPADLPLDRALAGDPARDLEIVLDVEGRPRRTVLAHSSVFTDPDGRVRGAVATCHDITDLRASERRFRAAFQDGPVPSARLDSRGDVVEANPALRRLLALPSRLLHGRPLLAHVLADDREAAERAVAGPGTGAHPVEVRLVKADGRPVWCELATTRSLDADGGEHVLAQLMSVDGRKVQEQRLELAASSDALTGLGNRSVLTRALAEHLDPATGTGAAVLFLDLDGFKAVNDTHGHEAGDAVLVETATRLLAAVRPGDVVVRQGGDEFCVVCPAPSGGPELLQPLARRLEDALGSPVEHGGALLTVGASVGLASGRPGEEPSAVLEAADRAMYARKQERRGVAPVGTPDAGSGRSRRAGGLVEVLRTAVAEDRLSCAYQPVVRVASGEVVGVEALLRLVDRSGRSVPPDAFIPVAEQHGLIGALGDVVLRTALAQAAAWKRQLPPGDDFGVGVNVSPLQLLDGAFVEQVALALRETGLDPAAVVLEVTEGRLLPDTLATRSTLRGLRELGVHLAVDDFGTGFASPGYLGAFPFDTLKIDRKYTTHLGRTGPAGRLAAGVFALARSTGLVLVAEGVETEAERDLVLQHGCPLAQGYLYSRPTSAEVVSAALLAKAVPSPRTGRGSHPAPRQGEPTS